MIKKLLIASVFSALVVAPFATFAEESPSVSPSPTPKPRNTEIRQEIKDKMKDRIEKRIEQKQKQIEKRDLRVNIKKEKEEALKTRNSALESARKEYLTKMKELETRFQAAMKEAAADKDKDAAASARKAFQEAKKELQADYQAKIKAIHEDFKNKPSPTPLPDPSTISVKEVGSFFWKIIWGE